MVGYDTVDTVNQINQILQYYNITVKQMLKLKNIFWEEIIFTNDSLQDDLYKQSSAEFRNTFQVSH